MGIVRLFSLHWIAEHMIVLCFWHNDSKRFWLWWNSLVVLLKYCVCENGKNIRPQWPLMTKFCSLYFSIFLSTFDFDNHDTGTDTRTNKKLKNIKCLCRRLTNFGVKPQNVNNPAVLLCCDIWHPSALPHQRIFVFTQPSHLLTVLDLTWLCCVD